METYLTPVNFFLALVATTTLLAIVIQWRLSLIVLLVQYLITAGLLAVYVSIQAAALTILAGALVSAILFTSARSVEGHPGNPGFIPEGPRRASVWSASLTGLLLRALALAVVGTGILGTALGQIGFEGGASTLVPAVWLAIVGVLFIVMARATFAAGLGLITLLMGIEAFYVAVNDSPIILGLLAIIQIIVALTIAYGMGQPETEPA
ncbi:MAG: hypothetical protein U0822_26680 [Anaerolineae bacterium]